MNQGIVKDWVGTHHKIRKYVDSNRNILRTDCDRLITNDSYTIIETNVNYIRENCCPDCWNFEEIKEL